MKKRISWKQFAIAVAAIVLLTVAAVGIGRIYENAHLREEEERLRAEAERMKSSLWTEDNTLYIDDEELGFDHRIETFLFIGTDYSGGQEIGNSGKTRQPMADFLMLMVLDHTRNSIGYIQIDRNTITPVWELNAEGKAINCRDIQICIANWYGATPEAGAENTVRSVREFLGGMEKIDGYYVLSLDDIELLNRSAGGVEIRVDDDVRAWNPELKAGETVRLTDAEAASYLRARMEVGEGTNAERMARQRNYVTGLFSEIGKKAESDPEYALELWNMLKGAACTNMNGNDFSRIAQKLIKGENMGIHVFKGETREGYASGDGELHEEFYPDMSSVKEELTEMFSLVPIPDEEDDEEPEADEEDEEDEEEEEPAAQADVTPVPGADEEPPDEDEEVIPDEEDDGSAEDGEDEEEEVSPEPAKENRDGTDGENGK